MSETNTRGGPNEPAAASTSRETPSGQPAAIGSIAAYPPPAPQPTQPGPRGIRFDFNLGCRVTLPEGQWRTSLRDLDTGNVLFEKDTSSSFINSAKRYFVRFRIEAWEAGESVFRHDFSAEGRDVLIQFPVGSLGDTIGWFPYAVRFQRVHRCRLTCAMSELIIPLFLDAYPDISFVTHQQVEAEKYYASYCLGLFFDDHDHVWQPCDFRHVGLHRTAGYILGVDPTEEPPRVALEDETPPLDEPYVCVAVQASTQCKVWNNPFGWRTVVQFLQAHGYRVVCIDRNAAYGHGLVWNHLPHGVQDETGDRPLTERARWLRHARFFVGLSSGLAWVAWAVGTPVVMISGFTHPTTEFVTPWRVINYHACNSCWNDVRHRFDHKDFLWCPRHAGTPRQFECTRLITADHVMATIRSVPGFVARAADGDE